MDVATKDIIKQFAKEYSGTFRSITFKTPIINSLRGPGVIVYQYYGDNKTEVYKDCRTKLITYIDNNYPEMISNENCIYISYYTSSVKSIHGWYNVKVDESGNVLVYTTDKDNESVRVINESSTDESLLF